MEKVKVKNWQGFIVNDETPSETNLTGHVEIFKEVDEDAPLDLTLEEIHYFGENHITYVSYIDEINRVINLDITMTTDDYLEAEAIVGDLELLPNSNGEWYVADPTVECVY